VGGAIVFLGVVLTVIADRPSPAAPEHRESAVRAVHSSLVWADEFQGPAGALPNRRNWSFETGGRWGGELQSYTPRPANASLDGKGDLAITARSERYTGADGVTRLYTSARLNTAGKFAFAYGQVEARIRIPAGVGLAPAFWALGSNLESVGWPASGEIDVMEADGSDPPLVLGTLHGPRSKHVDYYLRAERRTRAPLSDAFHVYGVSWSPGRVVFTVDGRRYGGFRRGDQPRGSRWTFDHPFFLVFTLAVGGAAAGRSPDATTPFPATMLVDWVHVWRGTATFCPTVRARSFRSSCPRAEDHR
jgi:beta-glucanase (GH16 family)